MVHIMLKLRVDYVLSPSTFCGVPIVSQNLKSLSLALVFVSACGSNPKSSDLASQSAESLNGTWAKLSINTSDSSAMGIKSQTKVLRYSLLRMESAGEGLAVQEKTCDLTTENSGSSSIKFPRALVASIADRGYNYVLQQNGSSSQLSIKGAAEVLGARLANPAGDPLPSSDTDATLFDQDADGKPGISVDVSAKAFVTISGTIYLSQRQVWDETINVIDENTARGSLVWSQEQKIFGASNPIFTSVSAVVTPLQDQSSVALKRLPDGAGCAEVLAQKAALFSK
jgi:hypothetical protein